MTARLLPAGLSVAVLMGGDSPEREISLASGICIAAALDQRGHRPVMVDPAEDLLDDLPRRGVDVCFLALHGGAGEDGRVQARLAQLGLSYTGSGPAASRLAMSKSAAKRRFAEHGVKTPDFVLFDERHSVLGLADQPTSLSLPLVVKPDGQGSSLGVRLARTRQEFQQAVAECRRFEPMVLCERPIIGREFTVALLGRRPLPPVEILSSTAVFSFQAKYGGADAGKRCDLNLDADVRVVLEDAAIGAAESLGVRGLSRVDLMLDRAGVAWVLEVNTIPGLTEHSLAPLAARAAGMDLGDLCEWMLAVCLAMEVWR